MAFQCFKIEGELYVLLNSVSSYILIPFRETLNVTFSRRTSGSSNSSANIPSYPVWNALPSPIVCLRVLRCSRSCCLGAHPKIPPPSLLPQINLQKVFVINQSFLSLSSRLIKSTSLKSTSCFTRLCILLSSASYNR